MLYEQSVGKTDIDLMNTNNLDWGGSLLEQDRKGGGRFDTHKFNYDIRFLRLKRGKRSSCSISINI